jgi:ABC-2 type transport system ATP-binding protein
MNIVQLKKVSRSYFKAERVLEGLDLDIREGEIVGLIGRNGAGKSTLMHLLMGMLHPQAGSVEIFGLDPVRHPIEVKQRIGYVAENQILPGSMTAVELLAIYPGLFPNWQPELAMDLAEKFDLPLRRKVNTLSKGQARSLALLLAISSRPDFLILDEPAAGLDPAMRREFLSTSIEHAAESGTTILFSSHQLTDVERLASRVALLHNGRIALDRATDSLTEDYSLATLPQNSDGPAMRALPGFLAARDRKSQTSALFERSTIELQQDLDHTFGAGVGVCRSVPLEELFIEFVGGGN